MPENSLPPSCADGDASPSSQSSSSSDYEDITETVALTARDQATLTPGVLPLQARPDLFPGLGNSEELWTGAIHLELSSLEGEHAHLHLKVILSNDVLHALYPGISDFSMPLPEFEREAGFLKASPITADQFIRETVSGCLRVGTASPASGLTAQQSRAFGISDWREGGRAALCTVSGGSSPQCGAEAVASDFASPFSGLSILGQKLACGLIIAAVGNPVFSFLSTSLPKVSSQFLSEYQDQAMALLWPLPTPGRAR